MRHILVIFGCLASASLQASLLGDGESACLALPVLRDLRSASRPRVNDILTEIAQRHKSKVIGRLMNHGIKFEDAEEIWNQTLLDIWRDPTSFTYSNHENAEWGYVWKIATGNWLDHRAFLRRKRRSANIVSLDKNAYLGRDPQQREPVQILMEKEERDFLRAEIANPENGLGKSEATILIFWLDGKTRKEAASELGCTETTAVNSMVRAKKKFAAVLEKRYGIEDSRRLLSERFY